MPIVIARQTGNIISKPDYTQDAYDRAWACIARAWAQKHPDELRTASTAVSPEENPKHDIDL